MWAHRWVRMKVGRAPLLVLGFAGVGQPALRLPTVALPITATRRVKASCIPHAIALQDWRP